MKPNKAKRARVGDILLVNYIFDPVGWLISLFTRCKYNHVALFIDSYTLIELTGTKVKLSKVSKYNSFLYSTKIVRPIEITKKQINEVIVEITKTVGRRHSRLKVYKGFIDSLNWRKPELDTCSGFIAKYYYLFGDYEFTLAISPELVKPIDIKNSEFVTEV